MSKRTVHPDFNAWDFIEMLKREQRIVRASKKELLVSDLGARFEMDAYIQNLDWFIEALTHQVKTGTEL